MSRQSLRPDGARHVRASGAKCSACRATGFFPGPCTLGWKESWVGSSDNCLEEGTAQRCELQLYNQELLWDLKLSFDNGPIA